MLVLTPAFDVVLLRGPWIVLVALLATSSFIDLAEAPTPRRSVACGLWTAGALLVNEGFALAPFLGLALLSLWIRPRDFAVQALKALADVDAADPDPLPATAGGLGWEVVRDWARQEARHHGRVLLAAAATDPAAGTAPHRED